MYAPKSSLSGSSEVTDEKEEAWLSCREACRSVSQVTEVKFVIHFIFVYEFTIPILQLTPLASTPRILDTKILLSDIF